VKICHTEVQRNLWRDTENVIMGVCKPGFIMDQNFQKCVIFSKCWRKCVPNLTVSMERCVGYVVNFIDDHTVHHFFYFVSNRNFPTTFNTSYILVPYQKRNADHGGRAV
jgi:hypothetical protein